ncbi:hypothetical protein SRHO_G00187680 [Serrasalmus rhombeus]
MMSQWPKFIKARTRALDSISSLTLELRASLHELLLNQLSRTMTERRKKGKKKKGQAVVSLLRMVLLLGCCRGGTSEREENRDKTLHDRNRTQTMKIMKPKKSLFFGTLQNPGAEKSGRDNSTGNQSQVCKENGQDTSGQHEHTDVKSQVYKGNGQDVTGPKNDTGRWSIVELHLGLCIFLRMVLLTETESGLLSNFRQVSAPKHPTTDDPVQLKR